MEILLIYRKLNTVYYMEKRLFVLLMTFALLLFSCATGSFDKGMEDRTPQPDTSKQSDTPLQECIQVLKTTAAMDTLALETGLCRSAQWLADDQARTGALGHTGSDGSDLVTRISRYGTWGILCGENCAYGSVTAREIVVQLLIDDGVPSRGHRINILKQVFKKVGIGFNKTGKAAYGAVTVMDFAGSYISQ